MLILPLRIVPSLRARLTRPLPSRKVTYLSVSSSVSTSKAGSMSKFTGMYSRWSMPKLSSPVNQSQ